MSIFAPANFLITSSILYVPYSGVIYFVRKIISVFINQQFIITTRIPALDVPVAIWLQPAVQVSPPVVGVPGVQMPRSPCNRNKYAHPQTGRQL
jgi:hypothetical protein